MRDIHNRTVCMLRNKDTIENLFGANLIVIQVLNYANIHCNTRVRKNAITISMHHKTNADRQCLNKRYYRHENIQEFNPGRPKL